MKVFTLSLACLALLAIESALTRPLGLSVARADVHAAFIVFFAARCQTLEGALGSFAVGAMLDAMSGQPSGLYVFSSMLTFLLARLVAPFVEVRGPVGFAVLSGALDWFHSLFAFGLVVLVGSEQVSRAPMFYASFPTAALSLLAAFVVWPVTSYVERLFKKPETGLQF